MKPKIIKTIQEMQNTKLSGKVGFVPTMGFLHKGHLSLIRAAKRDCDTVVVSIFVNPSQFGPNEDLSQYPRDFVQDVKLLSGLEVDYIFFPTEKEMYPDDFKTWVNVDKITTILCGKSRPIHFQGVTTIVAKLMNIVNPDMMFMGEKDFQQIVVLEQMIRDLNFKTKIVRCPLIREKDGLAMSSRNKYLSEKGRQEALCLYLSLLQAKSEFQNGNFDSLSMKKKMEKLIHKNNGIIDYIEFVDPTSLESKAKVRKGDRVLLAVWIEDTRLIDNMEI